SDLVTNNDQDRISSLPTFSASSSTLLPAASSGFRQATTRLGLVSHIPDDDQDQDQIYSLSTSSASSSALLPAISSRFRQVTARFGLVDGQFVDSNLRLNCCEEIDGHRWKSFALEIDLDFEFVD
ncbi:hypothetical protein U1Q18_020955, partial [Sarracenia purpurea var. burkii]